jgi:hypothetical protein
MLALCADARYTQKFVEVVQMLVVFLLDVLIQVHRRSLPMKNHRGVSAAPGAGV